MTTRSERFGVLMFAMGAALDKEVTAVMLEAYENALADLPIDALEAAAADLCKRAEWFPKPTHIRQLVEPDPAAGAADAWAGVLKQLKNHRAASFDLITARVIGQMGGSTYLATEVPLSEMHWKQKQFVELYGDEVRRQQIEARTSPALTSSQPAALIGDGDG